MQTESHRSLDIYFVQDLLYAEFPLSETPFIATLNAEDETLIITNPSSNELYLKGYYIADVRKLHKFEFMDEECKLDPHASLTLYTCPRLTMEKHIPFKEPYVMWRNTDGSLRKKEVLNNEGCEMLLYAPNHKCIASCLQTKDGKFEIRRREEEFQAVPSLKLSARSRLILSSLRIVILLCFAFCGADHITLRLSLYWIAFCCDMLSRDTPDPTEPWQLRRLNQYGDDINLFVLYIYAIMACEIPWLRGVLIVSAFFEFTSATLHSSSKTHGHGHGIKEDFYAYLRPSCPVLVSAICLLSEIFLLSYISPNSIQEGYVMSGAALTALAFVLRQINSMMAIITAVRRPRHVHFT